MCPWTQRSPEEQWQLGELQQPHQSKGRPWDGPSPRGSQGSLSPWPQGRHQPNPFFNPWKVVTAFENMGGITRCQKDPSAIKGKESFKESVLSCHYTSFLTIFPGAGISVLCARVSGDLSAAAGAGPEVLGPVCLGWEQLERSQKEFIVFWCVFSM